MSRQITFETYDRLMDARPFKLNAEEANYRDGEPKAKELCSNCFHLYTRNVDGYRVCAIVRDVKSDDEETPIKPSYTCDFFTTDAETFPFLEKESE